MKRWVALPVVLCALVMACAVGDATRIPPVRTVISLTFDDGWAEHARVGLALSRREMAGTFYVNSGFAGSAGWLSRAQIMALAGAGHEIGGHSINHRELPKLGPDERRREICVDRAALLGLGLQVRSFAYPYNLNDTATRQTVRECGYNSGRAGGASRLETIPPRDSHAIRTARTVVDQTTLRQLQEYVLQAERASGSWRLLIFHQVCDVPCGRYSTTWTILIAFLDWLRLRAGHGTLVRTVGDVIGGPSRPAPDGG